MEKQFGTERSPAERFLKLLLDEMHWSADMPQTGFDRNKGQLVLTTMSAQGHIAEFDISEKLYKRGVRVDE